VVEADDQPPPVVIQGVPGELQPFGPVAVEPGQQRHRFAQRQRATEAHLDARRRHRGGRIVALPAPVEEHFGPRVGVGLTHDHVVAARVHLAALVAGHHPGGNAGGPQQNGEGARIVLAEAPARVEQEPVDGIRPQRRRRQRVDERLLVEVTQDRAGELGVADVAARSSLARASVRGWVRAKFLGSCRVGGDLLRPPSSVAGGKAAFGTDSWR
jgi:hypothetical protein